MRFLLLTALCFSRLVSGECIITEQNPERDRSTQDRMRLEVLVVSLPVIVQDREGRFVTDLQRENFHIFDNGIEQKIAHFAPLEEPFSVVLLLDTSGSTRFRLKDIQDSALAFIDSLKPADRVYPISFDNQVKPLIQNWTNDRTRLSEAIRSTHTGMDLQPARSSGNKRVSRTILINTRLYDAVKMGCDLLRPVQGRKAMIVLSDGADNASKEATAESTLEEVAELGAFVYGIKYHDLIQRTGEELAPDTESDGFSLWKWLYLEDLSKRTGGRYYTVGALKNTLSAFSAIAEELRHQYSLGYYPEPLPRSGEERRIKVTVDRDNVSVRTRKNYAFKK